MFKNRSRQALAGLLTLIITAHAAEAQMFFDAEAVFLRRDNQGDTPFLQGPDAVSTSQGFGFEPGYRLTLGGFVGAHLQVDASFMQLNPWESGRSGVFTDDVAFDDSVALGVPSLTANTLVLRSGLREASMMNRGGVDQTDDAEFLMGGAGAPIDSTFATSSRSNFREFEVNIGSQREVRRWRVSAGYRHIRLDERNSLRLTGMFDAEEISSGNPGMLRGDALTTAGMQPVGGGPPDFEAYDPGNIEDQIRWQNSSTANNELNGAQATFALRVIDSEWITVEWISKVGIYRNNIHGRITETIAGAGTSDVVYQRIFNDSDIRPAFAGNWGLRGVVSLTDYINLIGGYNILYLSGVALGGDQSLGLRANAQGETIYRVRANNSLFAHGANVGLELLW